MIFPRKHSASKCWLSCYYIPQCRTVAIIFFKKPYSLSGASVQQLQSLKNSESVAVHGTVTMSCSYSGGSISDNNYLRWLQQKPGKVLKLLVATSNSRPTGVPARFTGTTSGNTMSLTIAGTLGEDEATYYCAVWTGSGYTALDSNREVKQKLSY